VCDDIDCSKGCRVELTADFYIKSSVSLDVRSLQVHLSGMSVSQIQAFYRRLYPPKTDEAKLVIFRDFFNSLDS